MQQWQLKLWHRFANGYIRSDLIIATNRDGEGAGLVSIDEVGKPSQVSVLSELGQSPPGVLDSPPALRPPYRKLRCEVARDHRLKSVPQCLPSNSDDIRVQAKLGQPVLGNQLRLCRMTICKIRRAALLPTSGYLNKKVMWSGHSNNYRQDRGVASPHAE